MYRPLDPSGGIRILVLEPSNDEAQISCRLIPHNINSRPDYKALSYEWGSQSDLKPITLNGQEVFVGENLWWALWYLRKGSGITPTRLWIDALCINQQDEKERGYQVSMMGSIYRNADVICWLGKGDGQKHVRAMEYICDRSSMLMQARVAKWRSGSSESATAKSHRTSIHDGSISKDIATFPPLPSDDSPATIFDLIPRTRTRIQPKAGATSLADDFNHRSKEVPHFSDIEALCSHSYWRRTWIIQEFVLGKAIQIRLGPREVQGEDFQYVAQQVLLQKLNEGGLQLLDAFRIFNLREDRLQGHNLPLVRLIELSEKSSCQDLRDRIYAMIGLASDCQHGEIVPDYSKPLSAVYDDVVIRHFYPSDRDMFGYSWATVCTSYLVQRVLWKTSESLSECMQDSGPKYNPEPSLLSVHGKDCGTVTELNVPQGGMWWAHPGLVKSISPSPTNNEVQSVVRRLSTILPWFWKLLPDTAISQQIGQDEEIETAIMQADIGGSLDCYVPGSTQVGDRICRFTNSSIVAVLRLQRESTILIGRGMILDGLGDLTIFDEGETGKSKHFIESMFHKLEPVLSFELTPIQLKSLASPHY